MAKQRLTIAVDCDEVLIHTTKHMVSLYNQLYGTSVPLHLAHTSGIPDWGVSRETVYARFDAIQCMSEYLELQPPEVTIATIRRLAERHNLHVVTARPESVMATTRQMITRYFEGCFTSIQHLGQDGDKGTTCRALHADVLVDDSLRHLVRAKECGITHRLWFGDYVWQTDTPEPGSVTRRCRDWRETEAEIDRIASQ